MGYDFLELLEQKPLSHTASMEEEMRRIREENEELGRQIDNMLMAKITGEDKTYRGHTLAEVTKVRACHTGVHEVRLRLYRQPEFSIYIGGGAKPPKVGEKIRLDIYASSSGEEKNDS